MIEAARTTETMDNHSRTLSSSVWKLTMGNAVVRGRTRNNLHTYNLIKQNFAHVSYCYRLDTAVSCWLSFSLPQTGRRCELSNTIRCPERLARSEVCPPVLMIYLDIIEHGLRPSWLRAVGFRSEEMNNAEVLVGRIRSYFNIRSQFSKKCVAVIAPTRT